MAVCSRCSGIYVGFLLGALLFPLYKHAATTAPVVLRLFAVLISLTVMDIAGNYLGLWHNTRWSRAILGALIGIVAARILVPGFMAIFSREESDHGTQTG